MKKTILITGANKGIGFETAKQLAQMGHHVIVSARNKDKLDEAVQLLLKDHSDVTGLQMDICDGKSVSDAAETLSKQNIKLDVLINNAAILLHGIDSSLLANEISMIEQVIKNNSFGTLMVIRSFFSLMNKPGRIINVSSGGGSLADTIGAGFAPAYCISKTLINGITKQLSYELEEHDISINSVCPGWVRTDMGGSGADRSVEKGAETIVWLASSTVSETGMFWRDKKVIVW
jgi:NAD(P)-dependent dehydrogenase (short-subunit alcohol dehydrogenase family)